MKKTERAVREWCVSSWASIQPCNYCIVLSEFLKVGGLLLLFLVLLGAANSELQIMSEMEIEVS